MRAALALAGQRLARGFEQARRERLGVYMSTAKTSGKVANPSQHGKPQRSVRPKGLASRAAMARNKNPSTSS